MTKRTIQRISFSIALVIFNAVIVHLPLPAKAEADEFKFGLTTSLSERYNDNIYLTEKQYKEDDFITSITLNPSLIYKTTATDFTLNYNPAFEFYMKNSEENEVRQNGSLNLVSKLTPQLTLSATDTLAFIQGQDVPSEERFIERERYNRTRSTGSDLLRNDFNSTMAYQILKNTSIRGGFGYSFDNYDRPEETDNDQYRLTLGMDHQLTGDDVLFGEYGYRMIRYHNSSLFAKDNDVNVHSFSIGNTHRFPRELALKISGGILVIDQRNTERETDWSARISLSKNFSTGSVEASFNRDVSPGSGDGKATINNTLSVGASKMFSRLWKGTFSTFYSTGESISHDEKQWEDLGFIAGAQYEFSRQLTGSLSCSYIRQNSKGIEGGDTNQYHARIGIDYVLRPNWTIFSSYSYYKQNALDPAERNIENNIIEVGTRIAWF